MATLTRQSKSSSGLNPVTMNAAAAGGDVTANSDGKTELILRTSGTAAVVTISGGSRPRAADANFPALTTPDITISLGATALVHAGPFPSVYTDPSGNLNLTYSVVTGLTVGVIG